MRILVSLGMLVIAGQAIAASPTDPDPAVAFVTTGGYWEANQEPNSRRGQYRVIVTNSGWEHVSSRVQLQWIHEDPQAESLKVYKTIPVKELNGGSWSIGQPIFNFKENAFSLSGTLVPTNEEKTFLLRPTSLGQYKLESK